MQNGDCVLVRNKLKHKTIFMQLKKFKYELDTTELAFI